MSNVKFNSLLSKPLFLLTMAFLAGFSGALLVRLVFGDSATAAVPAASQNALLAGELRLADESGRTRLLMTLVRGKPRLFMLDDDGEYRLEMGLGDKGEPHIWLRDREGNSKVQTALTAKGLPSFTLADQNGKDRAVLALSQEGEPTLILRDPKGADRVALWRDKNSEGLALADSNGRPIAAFNAKEGERAELNIY